MQNSDQMHEELTINSQFTQIVQAQHGINEGESKIGPIETVEVERGLPKSPENHT
jgi:hypothetical protein